MTHISPRAFAELHNVTRQRVMQWLAAGRIPGAVCHADALGNKTWTIPARAKRPDAQKRGPKIISENQKNSR